MLKPPLMLKGFFRQKAGPARYIDIVGAPIEATDGQRVLAYLTSPDVLAGMLPVATSVYGYASMGNYNAAGFALLYGGGATVLFNTIARFVTRTLSGKFKHAALDPRGQAQLHPAAFAARDLPAEQKQLVKKMGVVAGAVAITAVTMNADAVQSILSYMQAGLRPHPYHFLYLGIPITSIWTTAAAAYRSIKLSRGDYSIAYHR